MVRLLNAAEDFEELQITRKLHNLVTLMSGGIDSSFLWIKPDNLLFKTKSNYGLKITLKTRGGLGDPYGWLLLGDIL